MRLEAAAASAMPLPVWAASASKTPSDLGIEWDAENRLLAVNQGTQRTEFTYSGSGDRVAIIEKTGGTVVADRRFVACDGTPCEERDAGGSTIKRFFEHGVQQSGTAFYYLKDHLGSIVGLTDATATVRARYSYDPFGRRVKVSGDAEADLGFTGHFFHSQSGLDLALYRSYEASLGRWISPDSLSDAEQREGPNLYAYVANRPTVFLDFLGLERVSFTVITIIRPNAYRPGAKSWHRMFVDTASGAKTRPDEKWIGYTEDPIFRLPVSGSGSLEGEVSGGQGCISLYFKGVVKSFFVAMPIDYFFIITYSSNSGHGRLRGRHDAYPSYTILKDRKGIYDFQQRSFWDLRAGAPKAMVDKAF
jgi:RHS repeat-associated protein